MFCDPQEALFIRTGRIGSGHPMNPCKVLFLNVFRLSSALGMPIAKGFQQLPGAFRTTKMRRREEHDRHHYSGS
jgi:hypothetical protein